MSEMELIDVVDVARTFATLAGWGYFRLQNIKYDKETNIWNVTAYVGAYQNQLMKFGVDDATRKVISYKSADESNNQ